MVHSRWIQQLYWLVSARKPIWKGKKKYHINSLVSWAILGIPSRKKKITNQLSMQTRNTQVAQINRNKNINRTAAAYSKAENKRYCSPNCARVFLVFKSNWYWSQSKKIGTSAYKPYHTIPKQQFIPSSEELSRAKAETHPCEAKLKNGCNMPRQR